MVQYTSDKLAHTTCCINTSENGHTRRVEKLVVVEGCDEFKKYQDTFRLSLLAGIHGVYVVYIKHQTKPENQYQKPPSKPKLTVPSPPTIPSWPPFLVHKVSVCFKSNWSYECPCRLAAPISPKMSPYPLNDHVCKKCHLNMTEKLKSCLILTLFEEFVGSLLTPLDQFSQLLHQPTS